MFKRRPPRNTPTLMELIYFNYSGQFNKNTKPPMRGLRDMYRNARSNNNRRTGKHSHISILANQDKFVNFIFGPMGIGPQLIHAMDA